MHSKLRVHPNVCRLFGVCTKPENPICIVEEALTGSLLELIRKDIIRIDSCVAQIALDIASGNLQVNREGLIIC